MKFAICNELFEGWSFDRVCKAVKEAGYEGIELAPFTLAPRITDLAADQRAGLRAQAQDAGIQIIGLHWLVAKTTGLHLTSENGQVRERTAEYLIALAKACHDLGGDVMVFGSPDQRSLPPGVSRDQAFQNAAETFSCALPAIADLGVTICMEPLSPDDTDFVTTCQEGVELIEMVDRPNFVLHLDVKAMCSEETPITELIERYGSRAGHFHANDANLRGPGFGLTDFVPIFQGLRDARYNRWVSVEVFDFKPDPQTIAQRSIEYMQRCLQKVLIQSRPDP